MINGTSASTGCDSGALVVAGGVGIGGNLNVCGSFSGFSFNTNEAKCNLSVGDNTNNVSNGSTGVTAIGEGALQNNIGSYNTAVGCQALNQNISAIGNVGVGYKALINNTGGFNNVAIGQQAMLNNIGGSQNVAIGGLALLNETHSNNNTVVGFGTMMSTTGCNYNTSLGRGAMAQATNSTFNVAIGYQGVLSNTTGCGGNVAIGTQAMVNGFSATNNVAIGDQALKSSRNATDNIAIGGGAMLSVGQPYNCIAIGAFTLGLLQTGGNNVAIGNRALQNAVSGSGNIAIGLNALRVNITGSNNIAIGNAAGQNLNVGTSNNIDIGNVGIAGDQGMIRIGTNGTQTGCFIAGIFNAATGAGYAPVYINSSNQLAAAASSRNYKKDIEPLDAQHEKMLKLRPVSFTYKHDPQNNKQFGLIAEEVNEIYPELIVRDEAGEIFTINYIELIPLLLKNIQELEMQLQQQKVHKAQFEQYTDHMNEALGQQDRRMYDYEQQLVQLRAIVAKLVKTVCVPLQ